MFIGIGFSLVFSILLCVHVVKTGREMYWLFIILAFQPLGGIVYALVAVLPEFTSGGTARQLKSAARKAMDPQADYRAAQQAVEDSPTVANRMRLAAAASEMGRHEEAERMYAEAAHGIHAEDPALLFGRARALIELERPAEALPLLDKLGELGEAGRTPQAAVLMGRAHHMLGQMSQADTAYSWAAGRLPGLEGIARYAAFLAETGRMSEAREAMVEIEKRAGRATGQFRKEARYWRDFAAEAVRPD
ncbi:MAG: tetratricopeptide repeat protein [Caulobacter sp.]|nr:tetratricopeptide repeat protein [Caulobacter sp.]